MSNKEKTSERLYFIAIIPPAPIFEQAWILKHYFKDTYNSKASLNSPPHITLHMPFKWKETKEMKLISGLELFAEDHGSFAIQLENFNCFKPRVIYIDVIRSEPLNNLQRQLSKFCRTEFNLFNADHRDQPFHPHLTLAFRDLRKNMFLKAWEEFSVRKFEGNWPVNSFTLLKHDGSRWIPLKEFWFGR